MTRTMLLSVLFLAATLTGCGGNENNTDSGSPNEVTLTLSSENVTLEATGSSADVTVSSTREWGAYTSASWVSVTPKSSVERQTVMTITAIANTETEPRTATVTLMSGTVRKQITVTQKAGEADPNLPEAPEGYKLVWNDEFDQGSELATSKWTHEVQKPGWVNNELQEYVNGEHNGKRVSELKNGKLLITAFKDGGRVYSARVYGNYKTGWKYGIFEAKIKLPKGRGTWPAFWMMPSNNDFAVNPWPKCGEIDIMEEVGLNPNYTSSSIHCQTYNHSIGTQKNAERYVAGAEGEFHVYRLEWTEDYIQTFVDGEKLLRFDNDGQGNVNTWPFNKPFYLILNLAWGGTWGGMNGVDESALPCTMEVEYVRVYQKK